MNKCTTLIPLRTVSIDQVHWFTSVNCLSAVAVVVKILGLNLGGELRHCKEISPYLWDDDIITANEFMIFEQICPYL